MPSTYKAALFCGTLSYDLRRPRRANYPTSVFYEKLLNMDGAQPLFPPSLYDYQNQYVKSNTMKTMASLTESIGNLFTAFTVFFVRW